MLEGGIFSGAYGMCMLLHFTAEVEMIRLFSIAVAASKERLCKPYHNVGSQYDCTCTQESKFRHGDMYKNIFVSPLTSTLYPVFCKHLYSVVRLSQITFIAVRSLLSVGPC